MFGGLLMKVYVQLYPCWGLSRGGCGSYNSGEEGALNHCSFLVDLVIGAAVLPENSLLIAARDSGSRRLNPLHLTMIATSASTWSTRWMVLVQYFIEVLYFKKQIFDFLHYYIHLQPKNEHTFIKYCFFVSC